MDFRQPLDDLIHEPGSHILSLDPSPGVMLMLFVKGYRGSMASERGREGGRSSRAELIDAGNKIDRGEIIEPAPEAG